MQYVSETNRTDFCAAAGIADSGAVETFFVIKRVILLVMAAAVALMMGVGLARVWVESTQGAAYANPIEETPSAGEVAPAFPAETLRSAS